MQWLLGQQSIWRWPAVVLLGAVNLWSFAPHGYVLLSLLSFAVLFGLCLASPGRAFGFGMAFGVGYFGAGLYWLYESIVGVGGAPWWLSVLLQGLLAAFLALFFALPLASASWAGRRRWARLLWMVLAVTTFEWLRSWLLTGFPWLSLGYAFVDTPLAGLAPVLGVYGLSLAAYLSAAALLGLVWLAQGSRQLGLSMVLACALLWAGSHWLRSLSWSQPVGAPISVVLVQGNIKQSLKWRPGFERESIEVYRQALVRSLDADWVLWPETAVPVFFHQALERYLSGMDELLLSTHTQLLLGAPWRQEGISDGRDKAPYFNALVVLGADQGQYFKQHLVPFGEYLPLAWLTRPVLDLIDIPMSSFSAGAVQSPLKLGDQRVAVSICYESIFPSILARQVASPAGASVLVNISNDAWFGRTEAPFQHLQMARMRVLELARPMLRSTNTGVSAVIDHRARLLASSALFTREMVRAKVSGRSGLTVFARWRNLPILALLVGGLLSLGLWRFVELRRS